MNKSGPTNPDEICAKLLELPSSTLNENPRVHYLTDIFTGYPDDFCYFIGYFVEHLSTTKVKRDDAVHIMSDFTLAAMSIGRDEGKVNALREYGRPEYMFLLKKRGVACPA